MDTNSEYKSSPLVADLDDDGVNELVTADKFGMIRIYRGHEEIVDGNFPFQVQDGVWGAISSADIDLDGTLDFVVSSMSVENTDVGHIYIFDINGLKVDYNTEKWSHKPGGSKVSRYDANGEYIYNPKEANVLGIQIGKRSPLYRYVLEIDGIQRPFNEVYRKIQPQKIKALQAEEVWVAHAKN